MTLGDYLDMRSYGRAFRDLHLSPADGRRTDLDVTAPQAMLAYPATSFIRFHDNHGLLRVRKRPAMAHRDRRQPVLCGKIDGLLSGPDQPRHWRKTACGGAAIRSASGTPAGRVQWFDHVVIVTHADEALAMLEDPSAAERALLGAFRYSKNTAILHSDTSLMPKSPCRMVELGITSARRRLGRQPMAIAP